MEDSNLITVDIHCSLGKELRERKEGKEGGKGRVKEDKGG